MHKVAMDIKEKHFKNLYLLYGEENFLRKEYKNSLMKALGDPMDTMNFAYYLGKEAIPEKIIDLAETMPFMAQRRVIVIEDSGFFRTSQEKLADYCKEIPESTFIVFCEQEIDKRNRLYKVCKDVGYAAEFKTQTPESIANWITATLMRKEKKHITQRALDTFLDYVGTDMAHVSTELEKLSSYTLDKDDISEADVIAICTKRVESKIFAMMEATLFHRQKRALELYYDLIELKQPARWILRMLSNQCNQVYQTKLLRGKGFDAKAIAAKLSVPQFVADKLTALAAKHPVEALRGYVEMCAQSEENINLGKITDTLCVELLIVELSKAVETK